MKRLLALLLSAAGLVLCACGVAAAPTATATPTDGIVRTEVTVKGVSTLSLYKDIVTLTDNPGGDALCAVTYPQLALSEADAAAYPALSRAFGALNAESAANSQDAYTRLLAAADADMQRRAAAPTPDPATAAEDTESAEFEMFYRRDDLTVPRADSRAVSILYSMTSFSGGVHGNYYFYSTNLDTASGRSLLLSEVVTDMAKLRTILENKLRETYPKADFTALEDALNGYFADPASFTWTLDYEGLSFFFSPGELASFDDGKLICTLRFSELAGLCDAYYTSAPTDYVVPFTDGRVLNLDLNADGVSDEVSVEKVYSAKADEIEKLVITVGGREYVANTPMLDCTLYLVNISSARYYLYVSAQNLTGYGYVSVYKLDRSGASLVGMVYDSSLDAAGYADTLPRAPLLTSPGAFTLGTRIRYLGTLTGIKTYSVGLDGMPATDDAYYALSGAEPLTLKSQLVTATIDAAGSGTFAAATINPGTRMSFLRSDGAGALDMVTDTGVYCRLYVSGSPGAQYVNGMPAADLFDGMASA